MSVEPHCALWQFFAANGARGESCDCQGSTSLRSRNQLFMISQLNDAAATAVAEDAGIAIADAGLSLDVQSATPVSAGLALALPTLSSARLADVSAAGVRDLVKVFKLLSDETRLRILLYLTQRPELHVRALCDKLRQSQPAVSHHLALLRVAGLIECRREGKHNFYHLVPERFEQLLDTVFETVPSNERQIRFENYVLQYAP
jgi:ArsR family transcriptional regulator